MSPPKGGFFYSSIVLTGKFFFLEFFLALALTSTTIGAWK